MFYVHCLMLIMFSVASGSEDHSWREEIEKRLSVLEESNIQLKKENKELKSLILNSQHENKRLKSELENLRESVSNREGLIHRQNVDTEIVSQKMESDVGANDDSVTFYNGRNQPVPRIVLPDSYPIPTVAFYGYMSHSSAHNLSPHHPIVYDLVVTNKGNGYNKGDGIFIAPVNGVYAFHFSVCVIEGPELPWASLEITQNGKVLGSIFEEGTRSGPGYHCSSTLVISEVTVGDNVFIRTQEATRGPLYSDAHGRTSFSGWVIDRSG